MKIIKTMKSIRKQTNTLLILPIFAFFVIGGSIFFQNYLQQNALFDQQDTRLLSSTQQPADAESSPNKLVQNTEIPSSYVIEIKDGSLTSPAIKDSDTGEVFKYRLRVPSDWKVTRAQVESNDFSLVLERDAYRLEIDSPRFDDSICVYPTDKRQDGAFEEFDQYNQFDTGFGTIRVGRNNKGFYEDLGLTIFRVCQQVADSSHWKSGAKIGNILFRVPFEYDTQVILEMENLLREIEFLSS